MTPSAVRAQAKALMRVMMATAPTNRHRIVSVQPSQPKNWADAVGTPLDLDTALDTSLNLPAGSYQFINTREMTTSRKPVATPAAPLRFRYGASSGQNVIAKNSATPTSRNTTMRGEKTACLKAMPK